jgi:hydrogenase maturation factor
MSDERCITCGDVATVARVVTIAGTNATVEHGCGREEVAIELLADLRPGEHVLCHAGVALARADSGTTT